MSVPTTRAEIVIPARTIIAVGGALLLGWALVSVRDALLLVFLGVFLALVAEQPVRAVQRRLRVSRGLSATIVVLSALAVLTVLALFFLTPLVESARDFLQALPETVQGLRDSGELGWLTDNEGGERTQEGAERLAGSVPTAVSSVIGVAGEAFAVGIAIFTVTFTALFFLTDAAGMKGAAGSVMPPDEATRWLGVWDRITETVSRWAIGVVIIATIAGVTQGLTAYLLGSSFALALGLIAGFLGMIPNIGATIAGFVLSLTLLAEEGLTAALVMLVVVLVYQQVENSIITPTIQGKATNISAFFVIVGVTIFGALLGVLGALVAVPVTATIQIIVQEVTQARRERMAELRAISGAPPG